MKNKDKIEKLKLEIEELKKKQSETDKKIASMEFEFKQKYFSPIPWQSKDIPVSPNLKSETICPLCKMSFTGTTGYVCTNYSCPIFMKVTSCITTSCTGDFDIESLDPAERTWSYDGYGIKRLKSRWEE